jgi:hypothetical protein
MLIYVHSLILIIAVQKHCINYYFVYNKKVGKITGHSWILLLLNRIGKFEENQVLISSGRLQAENYNTRSTFSQCV